MLSHTKTYKPKSIKNLELWPRGTLTNTQFETWQTILLSHIKKDINWARLMKRTWRKKSVENRGITEVQNGCLTSQQCTDIDRCLAFISQYSPNYLTNDIIWLSTSLDYVWDTIREWVQWEMTWKPQSSHHTVERNLNTELHSYQVLYDSLLQAKQNHLQMARGSILHRGENPVTDGKLLASNQPNSPRVVRCHRGNLPH